MLNRAIAIIVLLAATVPRLVAAQPAAIATAAVQSMIRTHCLQCHSPDGGQRPDFSQLSVAALIGEDAPDTTVLERIHRRLASRQMPPADADRPPESEYASVVSHLSNLLDQVATRHPRPGRTDAVRRLNRTEYTNAVRDLLHLDIDPKQLLPADQAGHGFDNVTLGELPPLLLNRYITAAEKIARLAMGGRERSPGGTTVRLPGDRSQEDHVEGLPLGTRGGTIFTHQFTQSGDYEIQLRLMRDRDEKIEGLNDTYNVDVLLDGDRLHRFTVEPPKQKEGWSKDFTLLDAHLKKRFEASAGPHKVGVTFPRKSNSLLEIRRQPFEASFNRHRHPRQTPAIYEVSIVGPIDSQGPGDTPSRRAIYGEFLDHPIDNGAARTILQRLLRKAYRRDVTDADLSVPLKFYDRSAAINGADAGLESAIAAVLVNPHFLFRSEHEPSDLKSGSAYPVSDVELASRLSFFLWSSIPDDELLNFAAAEQLHEPSILKSQVQRMLADERSKSLVTNFAAQWLYLRNLESFKPDMRLYADFDDNLRMAMREETELLFRSVVKDNRSVLDLVSTDTTFLNERLARHYGIPGVIGSHFRPVKVSIASHRGGILRHASVLSVTSYATRTSPTIHGNWILENILGTPPPPPPANVPALKEKTSFKNLTVRERLAEHRTNPACASCHNLMDPIGFALENFDAVGRWRVFEDGQPIDSSGALPDGQQIDSVAALERGIIERPEMFVGTLTEKLLTFALGRGIETSDGPAVRRIVKDSEGSNYSLASIINGIVLSTPFQMRAVE